jgi:chorismate-pyruvate lyase
MALKNMTFHSFLRGRRSFYRRTKTKLRMESRGILLESRRSKMSSSAKEMMVVEVGPGCL